MPNIIFILVGRCCYTVEERYEGLVSADFDRWTRLGNHTDGCSSMLRVSDEHRHELTNQIYPWMQRSTMQHTERDQRRSLLCKGRSWNDRMMVFHNEPSKENSVMVWTAMHLEVHAPKMMLEGSTKSTSAEKHMQLTKSRCLQDENTL